ncbi:MAG: thioredoxin family protein [Acidimicrobiales bacterium]
MDPLRLSVVVLVVVLVLVGSLVYQRSRRIDERRSAEAFPPLPLGLISDAAATWVIFTTPYCASCDAVERELRRAFPSEAVVRVDATEHPGLAERYQVRRAPTVLRADRAGRVLARVVGPEGLRRHLALA